MYTYLCTCTDKQRADIKRSATSYGGMKRLIGFHHLLTAAKKSLCRQFRHQYTVTCTLPNVVHWLPGRKNTDSTVLTAIRFQSFKKLPVHADKWLPWNVHVSSEQSSILPMHRRDSNNVHYNLSSITEDRFVKSIFFICVCFLMLLFADWSKIKVFICKFQIKMKELFIIYLPLPIFLDFSVSLIKLLTTELNEFLRLP